MKVNFLPQNIQKDFQSSESKKAFTLIEVLVSVGLFTVVAITGITATLFAKNAYEKSRDIRSLTDSLMFIMEDISRTSRLGDLYHCVTLQGSSLITLSDIETPLDGDNCDGVAYEPFWNMSPGDPEDQIIYVLREVDGVGAMFSRRIDSSAGDVVSVTPNSNDFQRITPVNFDIDLSRSGFTIAGASTSGQPRILIRLHGMYERRGQQTEISLQTTLSQRAIPIE